MSAILQIEHLTHTYSAGTPFQRDALRDVSFQVERGEFLGVIGHTGSGKSTLIQHLNGLLKPTEGRILLDGRNIWAEPKKIRAVRFRVGLVFQYPEYQLFEETVYKDIAFGPTNMGLTGGELDRRVREAARLVGIRDAQLNKSPFELSGGQKRRVALAGVLAMEPEVLILDEPTAGLDPAGRENLMANIRDYQRAKDRTIILVSHSMDEIAQNADRILALKSARVLMTGTPREVFARGEDLLSAGLDVPQAARIAMALRQRGVPVEPGVYTVESLERALLSLRSGERGAAGSSSSADRAGKKPDGTAQKANAAGSGAEAATDISNAAQKAVQNASNAAQNMKTPAGGRNTAQTGEGTRPC